MDTEVDSVEELIILESFRMKIGIFRLERVYHWGIKLSCFWPWCKIWIFFAWSPYEVSSIDPNFIVHKLNVDPLFLPKKQKLRRSTKQHVEAMKEEVEKLK